jgi:hypothetical protein
MLPIAGDGVPAVLTPGADGRARRGAGDSQRASSPASSTSTAGPDASSTSRPKAHALDKGCSTVQGAATPLAYTLLPRSSAGISLKSPKLLPPVTETVEDLGAMTGPRWLPTGVNPHGLRSVNMFVRASFIGRRPVLPPVPRWPKRCIATLADFDYLLRSSR